MISTFNTKLAAAGRAAALAGLISAAAAAAMVGFAGAAHADPLNKTGMYGNPGAAAPYWGRQKLDDCVEMSVADVVGQITGHEPAEQQIDQLAQTTPSKTHSGPIYTQGHGTPVADIPALLAHYGVQGAVVNHGSSAALEQDLAHGQKVIVIVNNATIWNASGDRTNPNHAVVLTGIDTKANVVHLNDSGVPHGRDEKISLATFEHAWAASQNQAVVTK